MTEKNSKLSIGKLFYNDKFVMLFSILLAFVLWIVVSTTNQESTTYTVSDIPITLPELTNDLKFYGAEGKTVDAKISGNALVVTGITTSDILVTAADISEITQPGNYTLNLVPKKNSVKTDYSFESTVVPSTLEVYVDRYAEKKINITGRISVDTEDEYGTLSPTLSQQTVTVTGAEKVVNSIASVYADYTNKTKLSETTIVNARLVFCDANDNEIDTTYISSDISSVDVTIPVYKNKQVSVVPSFVNMPDSTELDSSLITVEPSTIKLAVTTGAAEISSVSTEQIDMTTINKTNNKLTVELVIPSGYRTIDGTTTATVTIDTSGMIEKKLKTGRITVINSRADMTTTVSTQNVEITLIGPADEINSITSANITGIIDMSEKSEFEGTAEMPLILTLNSKYSGCWCLGNYTAFVTVSEKQESAQSSS